MAAGQRCIHHGGPVGIGTGGPQTQRIGQRRAAEVDAPSHGDPCLQLIAADDLRDIQEHRRVRIAQLHDVEQSLLLPRGRDGLDVVEAVAIHARRAKARAAG